MIFPSSKFKVPNSIRNGFTLIEMLVAVGALSFVILISLSSFLAVLNAQKKTAGIQNIQENLIFSMEMMLREIRTGTFYYCGYGSGSNTNDCQSGNSVFTFKNYLGKTVIYRLNNGRIEKSSDGGSTYSVITFPEINVSDLKFYVVGSTGAGQGDSNQPRVTITMKGEAEGATPKLKSQFNVQTTISQRLIDA